MHPLWSIVEAEARAERRRLEAVEWRAARQAMDHQRRRGLVPGWLSAPAFLRSTQRKPVRSAVAGGGSLPACSADAGA